jgi:hypothetical protein
MAGFKLVWQQVEVSKNALAADDRFEWRLLECKFKCGILPSGLWKLSNSTRNWTAKPIWTVFYRSFCKKVGFYGDLECAYGRWSEFLFVLGTSVCGNTPQCEYIRYAWNCSYVGVDVKIKNKRCLAECIVWHQTGRLRICIKTTIFALKCM